MSKAFTFRAVSENDLNFTRNDFGKNIQRRFRERPPSSPRPTMKQEVTPGADLVDHIRVLIEDMQTRKHEQNLLADWLTKLVSLTDTPDYHAHSQMIEGVEPSQQAGVWFRSSSATAEGSDILLFGEFRLDDSPKSQTTDEELLGFFNRAEQLYAQHPTRRYLFAFLVSGTIYEFWVFDRSGAYSSEELDLKQDPWDLAEILMCHRNMKPHELGFSALLHHKQKGSRLEYKFGDGQTFYLEPKPIAKPDYIVGPGTVCYAASESPTAPTSMVFKYSWRREEDHVEVRILKKFIQREVRGAILPVAYEDLESITDVRENLEFPEPYQQRTLSCVVTTPLGRPLQTFSSTNELLGVFGDIVRALEALYVDGWVLHRDIAIKNIVISKHEGPVRSDLSSGRGVLIDFDSALDLEQPDTYTPILGSDGFVAIEVLQGKRHTERHELESLFYVFLWLVIGNDRVYEHPTIIMLDLPATSRLRQWVLKDKESIAAAKAFDMSAEGFPAILEEVTPEFAHLRDTVKEIHDVLFPSEVGMGSSSSKTKGGVALSLYDRMYLAFMKHYVE